MDVFEFFKRRRREFGEEAATGSECDVLTRSLHTSVRGPLQSRSKRVQRLQQKCGGRLMDQARGENFYEEMETFPIVRHF